MTSLAVTLAQLRESETSTERVAQFDVAIALAMCIEQELGRARRALAVLHEEYREEAELAEREADARRAGQEACEAAIAVACASGKLIRFPAGRVRRYGMAAGTSVDVA